MYLDFIERGRNGRYSFFFWYNKYNIWHDDSFQGVKKMGYHSTIAKILLSAIKRGFEVAAILNRKLNWYFLQNGWYK